MTRYFCLSALLLLVSPFILFADVAAQEVNTKGFTAAEVCGSCHEAIYDSWKSSMHAHSLSNPNFDTSYTLALRLDFEKARKFCLRCHAPIASHNKDYGLEKSVTREGISCTFCHSVTAINFGQEKLFNLKPGNVVRSALSGPSSAAHKVTSSPLHKKAEFCGSCHEYTNERGVSILETLTEWRDSPYSKEGKTCQNCHMIVTKVHANRGDVKSIRGAITRHSLIGARNIANLKWAVDLQIVQVTRNNEMVSATIEITNIGAGHKIPTGIPSRGLVLRVQARAGGELPQTKQFQFRKVITDEKGRTLLGEHDIFLRGAAVVSDNRLRPMETVRQVFHFKVPKGKKVNISAKIFYVFRPTLIEQKEMTVLIDSVQKDY